MRAVGSKAQSPAGASSAGKSRTKRFWNWKLIGIESVAAFLAFYAFNAGSARAPKIPSMLEVLVGAVLLWLLYREFFGVTINREEIAIPTNRVAWMPILSFGRRKIRLASLSRMTVAPAWYSFQIVRISGDFGSDVLVFQTRGQRRRFTSLIEKICPKVVVYRSRSTRVGRT
jgi:hypothetical protein